MSIDDALDLARDMPLEGNIALAVLACLLLLAASSVQVAAVRLRHELDSAEEELVDRETGLLPRSAIPVRLGVELTWAESSATPLTVAALRIRGSRFVHAARVLRHAMRGEEQAFLLGDQRVLVELWGTDVDAAADATRRLGDALRRAGHPVVDAGIASAPRDGVEPDELIAAALRDLRPVDDPVAPGHEIGRDGAARTPIGRAASLAWAVLPWFALQLAMLTTTWLLLPAAIEPALDGGARTSAELAVAIIAAIGLPLGAALLHLAAWNFGGGRAPASHPHGPAGAVIGGALALIVGVPLAWGIFAPNTPDLDGGVALGAMLAMFALVIVTLLHARQLVAAVAPVLVLLLALGVATTWLAVETTDLPLVANVGRLVAGAALGALLARYIERASWLVGLALLAAAVDAWSVTSDSGLTSSLLGVTDLVFVALFLAWAHDWRLDMRIVTGVLIAASWVAVVATMTLDEAVPVLPVIAGAMVFLLAARSVVLHTRRRTWRRALTAADAPFAG